MADDKKRRRQSSWEELRIAHGISSGKSASADDVSRPSVIHLVYSDENSLQKAYMPFIKGGGLFIPIKHSYSMNEEVFLLVTLPDSGKSFTVPGAVVWKTPAKAVDGRVQGVGVKFEGSEGNVLRSRIESILGGSVGGADPTHTM